MRGLLFKGHLIDRIVTGTKRQTRRLVREDPRLITRVDNEHLCYWIGDISIPFRHRPGTYFLKRSYTTSEKVSPGIIQVERVWMERLSEISAEDLRAEGYERRADFFDSWDSLHAHPLGQSAANPYVECLSFTLLRPDHVSE